MSTIQMKIDLDASDKEWLEFLEELNEVIEFINEKGIAKALDKYAKTKDQKSLIDLFESVEQEHLDQASERLGQLLDRAPGMTRQQ
ncbi:MAG: hypothetical protein GOVbin2729_47 [Prokaryotic dsDNA virus sp.]|nr:MAG: hypothetical protein GOVbin2729_47 [Prokaryotic dsDNA virus sp.]